jgi:glycosyltransferase involved in cell wall biosynthesis
MQFTISVIIPTYNAERFIEKAILSALQQEDVFEVIVVNDGSTDATFSIIEGLQKQYDKIRMYSHENGINKGRSASRNLGIQKATGNFVAFLDADDFYLENRFVNDKKLFNENESVDGVYNAIGVYFYREATEAENKELDLTTVTESIHPSELFEALLSGKKGYFSIDGLIVKKSIFTNTGYFSEDLVVAEDTELILKMTLKGNLVTGIIDKPVTLRGVHDENSFSNEELYKVYRIKMYDALLRWCVKEKTALTRIAPVLKLLWDYRYRYGKTFWEDSVYWTRLALRYPQFLKMEVFVKNFPLIRRRKTIFKF